MHICVSKPHPAYAAGQRESRGKLELRMTLLVLAMALCITVLVIGAGVRRYAEMQVATAAVGEAAAEKSWQAGTIWPVTLCSGMVRVGEE